MSVSPWWSAERLDSVQEMWELDLSQGGPVAEGGSLAKSQAEAGAYTCCHFRST
jgi:hypothetical protein